jgi:hypothetical protein
VDEPPSKGERLAEFLRRLAQAPRARTFDEAYEQLCRILNEAEHEMTAIPFDPDSWRSDGRLYPPLLDNLRVVENRPLVRRLRSIRHNTFVGLNGSIEIQELPSREVIFSKPGLDSRGVWEI